MSPLADTIHKERYAHHGELSWSDTAKRVAYFVAQGESQEKQAEYASKFFELIDSKSFIPGGRILANAGRPRGQLLNCFVLPLEDSRESIGQMLKEYLIISGTGGGVGISFSKLRPRNTPILTNGGSSSGSVSFMDCVDSVANTIKTGGGRRAATMISLSAYHPDLEEFLSHKLDLAKLTNANVSVEVDQRFLDAVRTNTNWDLTWAGKVVKTVNARDIWNKLVENAHKSGEPGILNIGLAKKMSNSYYFADVLTTNPCGEIFLPSYGCCCLGSINLANYVDKDQEFNWERFKTDVKLSVRFLDNILTVNEYPLETIKQVSMNERRVGLGLMGLHTALLQMNLKYSSNKGMEFSEKVYECLRNVSYTGSVELAIEKGPFPKFDAELFLNSGFAKTLTTKIRKMIREGGMRNVCVNTQAPTGTTSMVADVSSGIEPIFAPVYDRRFRSEETKSGFKVERVVDPLLQTFLKEGRKISHFEGAYDVAVEKHMQVQETAQRYVDQAISKTINLPEDYPVEKLSEVWLKYADQFKGTTLYRSGSRGQEPLKPVESSAENMKELKAELELTVGDQIDTSACKSGVCAI